MTGSDAWRGRLFFGPGRLLYAGPIGTTALHAHHTFQVGVALEGTLSLRDAEGALVTAPAAVVPPGARHAVEVPCPAGVLLHVAPEDLAGRGLRALGDLLPRGVATDGASRWAHAGEPLRALLSVRAPRLPDDWQQAEALAQQMLDALGADRPRPRPLHPAITRLLRLLPELLDDDVRTPALATRVGLSAGRLSHLFGAEVGLPLRPYVRWLRLHRAAEQLQAGATLTAAAHAAGFTDSAHLSHVFRRTFGLTPSELTGGVQWVLPPAR